MGVENDFHPVQNVRVFPYSHSSVTQSKKFSAILCIFIGQFNRYNITKRIWYLYFEQSRLADILVVK